MSNNTNYSTSRVFTKNDLITIKKILRKDKNPKGMYQYLASKGDRYALFAGLSGSESGFWGRLTLYFRFNSDIILDKGFLDDRYSVPKMPNIPEFSYSGYSSGGTFSFN
ncbi:hypothetical protein [Providencia heimbachae]|uniref:Uncharacterized protein n=1 Tax=Providencia heimbachae ATCC 35613 TaxID=1354272 RepID=A0A1B7JZS6_9GAMM|nr:hypothetical protein [Providencia heimbachae]OAT53365.1 hypothetical protein M998_1053 [Providencia heimbachae ATCC 35613]SQH14102.1 Uncharacterised protein [Providencia heimbachae]